MVVDIVVGMVVRGDEATGHQAGFVGIGGGEVICVAGGPHTLKTIFMLCDVQRPPIRL